MAGLKKRDIEILDVLAKSNSVKKAANTLGVGVQILYNWSDRMRKKKVKWRWSVNTLLNYQKRSRLIAKILTLRGTEHEEN